MDSRTRTILETAVGDFIKTGRPITSEVLFRDYDFGIRPAMIRRELHELSEDGYFYQTHPSGGRFPSDRAYEFYVNQIVGNVSLENKISVMRHAVQKYKEGDMEGIIDEMNSYLDLLSVGYTPHDGQLYEYGLRDLLEQLHMSFPQDIIDVVNEIELLRDRIPKRWETWEKAKEWPKVFIGENPVTRSKYLSLVAHRVVFGQNEQMLLIAIGPKRMDYEKSLNLLRSLEQYFQ